MGNGLGQDGVVARRAQPNSPARPFIGGDAARWFFFRTLPEPHRTKCSQGLPTCLAFRPPSIASGCAKFWSNGVVLHGSTSVKESRFHTQGIRWF